MNPRIDIINLGVRDQARAHRFYERGLGGLLVDGDHGVSVTFGGRASELSVRDWQAVASDAGTDPESMGFRGFTMSYIVDSADAVDHVLESATQHGGRVSKPPKNALWGYSAYITDPDGYLWKIASSKRRPLLRGAAKPIDAPVKPQEVPLTIGVGDMKRSKAFYEDAIRLPVKKAYGTKFVMFGGEDESSDLGMYKREALADDAAVAPDGFGFHGFTITHIVDSAEAVDKLLARAKHAGGAIRRAAEKDHDGTCSGSFADLDGYVWQVATRV